MQKTIEVIFEGGVFRPLKKVKLPEHAKFRIAVLKANNKELSFIARKQSESLLSLAGLWASGDRDVSENTDKYLYGTSRK